MDFPDFRFGFKAVTLPVFVILLLFLDHDGAAKPTRPAIAISSSRYKSRYILSNMSLR
jgi:hypothetical protein